MDENVTDEEKIRIVSDFIIRSPAGEFNEVFHDCRVLLNNDYLLKEGAAVACESYSKEQLTPVKINGSNFRALITDFNALGGNRFLDPRSQQSFKFDSFRKEASDFITHEPDQYETWRRALEDQCSQYTQDHFRNGTCSVFSTSSDDDDTITLVCCIEDHAFEAKNFWNGKWRSIWSISFSPDQPTGDIQGTVKAQVHIFENGNVQCLTNKFIKEPVSISTEQKTAIEIMQIIEEAENEYQCAIFENYQAMSDTTFKALRRQLPVTRTKIDWQKIVTFKKLGTELKQH